MAIKFLVRKVWTGHWSWTSQKLSVLPSQMFWISSGLEHISITPPMALCITYFKNNMLHAFCVTNKTVSVVWVSPRARESPIGNSVFNKSYDVKWTFCAAVPLECKMSVAKRSALKYLARFNRTLRTPRSVLKQHLVLFCIQHFFVSLWGILSDLLWALYKLKNDHNTSRDYEAWPDNLDRVSSDLLHHKAGHARKPSIILCK